MQTSLSQLCRVPINSGVLVLAGHWEEGNRFKATHTGTWRTWPSLIFQSWLHFFFKIAYYWGEGKEHVLVMTASRAKWNSRHSRGQIFLGWWRSPHPVSLSVGSSMLPSPFLDFWTFSFSKAFAYPEWLFGQLHQKFQPGREEGRGYCWGLFMFLSHLEVGVFDTHCNVVALAVWIFRCKWDKLVAGRTYINDYED